VSDGARRSFYYPEKTAHCAMPHADGGFADPGNVKAKFTRNRFPERTRRCVVITTRSVENDEDFLKSKFISVDCSRLLR